MKRLAVTVFALVLLLSLVGCAATVAPAPPTASPVAEVEKVLEVGGAETSIYLTDQYLKSLPSVTGMGGIKSSTGEITPPREFKGVAVSTLLDLVPGFDESAGIMAEAKDGYTITFSYDQAVNGDFIFYDPITGDEKEVPEGTAVLAVVYEDEGQPIDDGSGPLRLMALSPEGDQVIDGHWAVKWIRRLIVKDMGTEWTLNIEGGISAVMDRGTFESGAAPGCHGASWVDEGGQEWVGIPLWRLAGWGDDEIKHEGPAFSDELAKIGYEIEVIAADGYSVMLDSDRVTRHDEILVAYLVNGEPLPEKYFPLRLVGEGLEKSEMVGNIATIRLHLPETAPAVVAAPADLHISGRVNVEFGLSKDALSRMEMVTVSAQAPKADAPQDYTGVRIIDLLGQAEPTADATTLALVAYDGYEAEVDLAQVLACSDCLIGFDETGKLRSIMPDFGGGAWVKDLVALDVRGAADETAGEESEPAAEAVTAAPTVGLQIVGLVANPLELSAADLAALPATVVSAQHPKADAAQDWTGYRLNDLLALAEALPAADTLVITAADGYKSQLPLATVAACGDCLVAVDEGRLRMIMPGSESSAWVKEVATLELTGPAGAVAEEAAPEALTAAPTVGLEISGLVDNPLSLSADDLAALPAVAVSAQHPKAEAAQDWTGYRLSDLLALAEPQADAATLVITAADGFQAPVPLEDIKSCTDCLVAVEDGLLRMVMPDQGSKAWVKDVAGLELQ